MLDQIWSFFQKFSKTYTFFCAVYWLLFIDTYLLASAGQGVAVQFHLSLKSYTRLFEVTATAWLMFFVIAGVVWLFVLPTLGNLWDMGGIYLQGRFGMSGGVPGQSLSDRGWRFVYDVRRAAVLENNAVLMEECERVIHGISEARRTRSMIVGGVVLAILAHHWSLDESPSLLGVMVGWIAALPPFFATVVGGMLMFMALGLCVVALSPGEETEYHIYLPEWEPPPSVRDLKGAEHKPG